MKTERQSLGKQPKPHGILPHTREVAAIGAEMGSVREELVYYWWEGTVWPRGKTGTAFHPWHAPRELNAGTWDDRYSHTSAQWSNLSTVHSRECGKSSQQNFSRPQKEEMLTPEGRDWCSLCGWEMENILEVGGLAFIVCMCTDSKWLRCPVSCHTQFTTT